MAQRTLNRRSRTRDAEPDDEYQDNTPEGDEDEPPRRGRARGRSRDAEEEDEPRRPRSSRRSSDDEDSASKPKGTSRGWKGFKQKREERSDFVKNYAVSDDQPELIKMLDDEPFTVYAEHWIDERQGKKSFVCIGDDCPLCAIGDKPRVYAMFNVLDLRDPEDPQVFPWKVSQTVADILEGYATDKKTSPLNRPDLYFSVKKSGGGKKGRVQTNLSPVKERDLEEDWDVVPFTEDELDQFTLLTEDDVLQFSTRKALKAVADELD